MKKTRYFIISYQGQTAMGWTTGYMEFWTTDGSYLNKEVTVDALKDGCVSQGIAITGNIVIMNIIELSRKDFDKWTQKK